MARIYTYHPCTEDIQKEAQNSILGIRMGIKKTTKGEIGIEASLQGSCAMIFKPPENRRSRKIISDFFILWIFNLGVRAGFI
jgi:hypothetical protein